MIKRLSLRLSVALSTVVSLVGVGPLPASAQPANDDFGNATTISALPFVTTQDTSAATVDPSDPKECRHHRSVWFSFTPATDMMIKASTAGSDYNTVLSAWTGSRGALTLTGCNYEYYDDSDEGASQITFAAVAGTTYHFMVVASSNYGVGDLRLSIDEATAPANDDFADATVVGGLPFTDEQDLGGAAMESGEPAPYCGPADKTVWYSFTPTTTQSVTAKMNYWGGVVAYTGTSLADLTPIGCSDRVTFRAEAGTRYLFQVVEVPRGGSRPTAGVVDFSLTVASNPYAEFFFDPSDPSTLDTVDFRDASSDPARAGVTAWLWEFGDGTTSTERSPGHRYATDGDYSVRLTVTTRDGRTATTDRVVPVRTHDVAITRLVVPPRARVGQTITVRVHLRNTRLPETVRLDLHRDTSGGTSQVGSLTQAVKARSAARFVFRYQVTADDVAAGNIVFRATATLVDARDAIPADNTLTSRSISVRR